jgi:hypothetical protein
MRNSRTKGDHAIEIFYKALEIRSLTNYIHKPTLIYTEDSSLLEYAAVYVGKYILTYLQESHRQMIG